MDAKRFDQFSVVLAESTARRGALRLAAGAALGGLLTRLGPREAAAACVTHGKSCRRDNTCCSGFCQRNGPCAKDGKPTGKCRCRCPQGTTLCGTNQCCGGGQR